MPELHVAGGLILNDQGQALMTLRLATKMRPDLWEFPGGKVEATDTSYRSALVRELREELGVEVEVHDHVGDVEFDLEVAFNWRLFYVTITSGTPQPLEAQDLRWIAPLEAVKHLPCAPTTYAIYPKLRAFLKKHR